MRNILIRNIPGKIVDDGFRWLHKLIVQNDSRVKIDYTHPREFFTIFCQALWGGRINLSANLRDTGIPSRNRLQKYAVLDGPLHLTVLRAMTVLGVPVSLTILRVFRIHRPYRMGPDNHSRQFVRASKGTVLGLYPGCFLLCSFR